MDKFKSLKGLHRIKCDSPSHPGRRYGPVVKRLPWLCAVTFIAIRPNACCKAPRVFAVCPIPVGVIYAKLPVCAGSADGILVIVNIAFVQRPKIYPRVRILVCE